MKDLNRELQAELVAKERLGKFNVKIPFDIELIFSFCVQDALNLESKLHNAFKDSRLSGEWFDLDMKDIIELIRIGARREAKDYFNCLDTYREEKKKERWMNDMDYIKYLESTLVFNNIRFEARI